MAEPKVRFKRDDGGSYPGWKNVALNDIAKRITRKNTNGETNRPLTIASIEGLVDQRTYFGKTIASKDMSGYFLLKRGEYAYNKSYSVGYDYGSIKRLDKYDMGALSTLYICFALNENQNTDFYDCYFNALSWYNQMPQICAEGARNHGLLNVSPNDFFKIQLSVPSSKEEQQKIADFLSSIDDVISTSEQEVANLEKQKKAVMKKIFSREVRFKRADGSVFPEWRNKVFTDVAQLVNGRAYSADEMLESGKYMILRVGNLFSNNEYYYSDMELEEDKYINDGDLIYAWSATFGPRIYHGDKCIYHYHIWKVIPYSVEKDYFLHFLYADVDNLQSELNGGTMKHITKELMEKRIVPLPCKDEQLLIADFLSDFDEAIATAKKELELWKKLKKGLLQQMFV